MKHNVLDLETSSISGSLADGYALEPWRVRQGKAFISSLHYLGGDGRRAMIERPNRQQLIEFCESIAGLEVWAHNGPFDVAWLIASIEPNKLASIPECVKNIRWRDSLLLAKWAINGQRAERNFYSYSLANLVSDACRDMEGAEEFVAFKQGAPLSTESKYWQDRGVLDCLWTQSLVEKIRPRLLPSQEVGFIIEQACIPTVANSWLIGMKVNQQKLKQLETDLQVENKRLGEELSQMLARPFDISIVSSPKRMVDLLFSQLGLPVQKTTPSGAASTDIETLKLLLYELKLKGHPYTPVMEKIMTLKYNSTIMSKYVKTVYQALERTGDGCMYPVAKMFGTGTGRFTYSNETTKGVKVSFAAHQIPRKEKRVREYVEAYEGEWISEYDAMGQESRIMAAWSQDPVMVDIFANRKDFHAMTASGLTGHAYEDFMRQYHAEGDAGGPITEYRQMGKLGNLSCNFRIGGPALSKQAFVKYDVVLGIPTSNQIISTFKKRYRGVPEYWDRAIDFSRSSGYAATATDRRYKIDDWSRSWPAEQTAVSLPIQGTGAEHKLIALATVAKKIPEARFFLDLHDASFFLAPNEECHKEIGSALNSIDYSQYWTQCPTNVPLPFEGKLGKSFKDVK